MDEYNDGKNKTTALAKDFGRNTAPSRKLQNR